MNTLGLNENTIRSIEGFKGMDSRSINSGTQLSVVFENGYGASIVDHSFYHGLYLAVMDHETKEVFQGSVNSTTHITDDVMGDQSVEELECILIKISKLPKEN
jgi:hypothetical protein